MIRLIAKCTKGLLSVFGVRLRFLMCDAFVSENLVLHGSLPVGSLMPPRV